MYVAGDTLIATNKVYYYQTYASYINLPVKLPNSVQEEKILTNSNFIYPNPFKDNFNISLAIDSVESIIITDILGKSTILPLQNMQNLTNYNSGVYILTVRFKNGIINVEKLVKK